MINWQWIDNFTSLCWYGMPHPSPFLEWGLFEAKFVLRNVKFNLQDPLRRKSVVVVAWRCVRVRPLRDFAFCFCAPWFLNCCTSSLNFLILWLLYFLLGYSPSPPPCLGVLEECSLQRFWVVFFESPCVVFWIVIEVAVWGRSWGHGRAR